MPKAASSTVRRLNRDEVMKVWRLGGCENFVGKRETLVFDAFSDFEPVSWVTFELQSMEATGHKFRCRPFNQVCRVRAI